jgi:hypothetical protein
MEACDTVRLKPKMDSMQPICYVLLFRDGAAPEASSCCACAWPQKGFRLL